MENLDKILEMYYDHIGVIPNDTRQEDQVFARSAMMVVLRERMTLQQIGRLFGKNHATIHHACKNHENNHGWSKMYRDFYEAAKTIVYENPVSGYQLENKTQADLSRHKVMVFQLSKQLEAIHKECEELRRENTILQKREKECRLSLAHLQD